MPPRGDLLRALIVDDEALARRIVRELLAGHPDIEVVAECSNGFEAVKAVGELRPDILFLDIQMPKLDGFEVLELIDEPVEVIFITAHDEHALRAFSVHAVDYLLKPFSAERFGQALGRARERLRVIREADGRRAESAKGTQGGKAAAAANSGSTARAPAEAANSGSAARALAAAARGPGRFLDRVLVRDGAKVHVLRVESIDYIEAQDDYVDVRCGGKSHLKQQTLAEIETSLDPARFVRIHRSYILNVERLVRIEPYAKDSRVAILADGTRLPVSRAGYQRLRDLL